MDAIRLYLDGCIDRCSENPWIITELAFPEVRLAAVAQLPDVENLIRGFLPALLAHEKRLA